MRLFLALFAGTTLAFKSCPANESYNTCGNACHERKCCDNGKPCFGLFTTMDTHSEWMSICPNACQGRCECNPGYFRDPNSLMCVQSFECTYYDACDQNEYWNECGSSCKEEKCVDLLNTYLTNGDKVCGTRCEARCQCKPGFYRDDNGKCVSRDSCPNTYCKPNETYQECGNRCMEPTCAVADTSDRICDTSCDSRCQCDEGFVRDQHGNCIEPEQCPNTYCPYNEVYTGCVDKCKEENCYPRSCWNTNSVCEAGCVCKKGTVRDKTTGKCIEASQCGKCFGVNEEWTECGNQCREPTCGDDKVGKKCPTVCERRCQCKIGYVRNNYGECITLEMCPIGARCDSNEYWNNCGSACHEPDCEYPLGYSKDKCGTTPTVCTPRCECKMGFVRRYGKCVRTTDCEATCDAQTEEFSTCGSACREDKCPGVEHNESERHDTYIHHWVSDSFHHGSDILPNCPSVCERRCECLNGYSRNHKGNCVKTDQCELPPCPSNEFRQCINSPCEDAFCKVLLGQDQCASTQEYDVCKRECICMPGYARDELGKCIVISQCLTCGENEQKVDHYCECMENQCPGGVMCLCNQETGQQKNAGCICKNGYVRDSNGVCQLEAVVCTTPGSGPATTSIVSVDPISTGPLTCGVGEVWYTCFMSCTEQKCGEPYAPCLPNCSQVGGGCGCKMGWSRDQISQQCVEKCPYDGCPKNEVETDCYEPCMDTACEKSCKPKCKKNKQGEKACRCIDGYVRNSKGKCIPKSTENCCLSKPNMVWSFCSDTTTENKCPNYIQRTGDLEQRSMIVQMPDYVPPTPKPTCTSRCECLPGYYLTRDGCVPNLQACDNIAPEETPEAIQCGCDVAKVVKQILGEGVKRVECTKPGKKGGLKGSEWTLSCLFQGTMKHGMHNVPMGKNCKLQKTLTCGFASSNLKATCNCGSEFSRFKDIKCLGDNKWSCTDKFRRTITFKGASKPGKCKKSMKKCKCALK